jgi:hypothetical protein
MSLFNLFRKKNLAEAAPPGETIRMQQDIPDIPRNLFIEESEPVEIDGQDLPQYVKEFDNLLEISKLNPVEQINNDNLDRDLPVNPLKAFAVQMEKLITIRYSNFNEEEAVNQGKQLALENNGSPFIFKTKLDSFLANLKAVVDNEKEIVGLIKADMMAHFEATKSSLENKKDEDLNLISQKYKVQKLNFQDHKDKLNNQIIEKKQEKLALDSKQIELNAQIKKIDEDILSIDQNFTVQKWKTLPNILFISIFSLLTFYLCNFFASAFWKIFFERGKIMEAADLGIDFKEPGLVDFNAISKTFAEGGLSYAFASVIFFLIPVLFTNFGLLVPKENKPINLSENRSELINNVLGKIGKFIVVWVIGVFLIDVTVAVLISQHTAEMRAIANGTDYSWQLKEALQTAEFWLIFIFGALPLFIYKYLVLNLHNSYKKSSLVVLDQAKSLERKNLMEYKVALGQSLNSISGSIEKTLFEIETFNNEVKSYEIKLNELRSDENIEVGQINERYVDLAHNIDRIYHEFINQVNAGARIFMKSALSGILSAFRRGYYSYYSENFTEKINIEKVQELEQIYLAWSNENFKSI